MQISVLLNNIDNQIKDLVASKKALINNYNTYGRKYVVKHWFSKNEIKEHPEFKTIEEAYKYFLDLNDSYRLPWVEEDERGKIFRRYIYLKHYIEKLENTKYMLNKMLEAGQTEIHLNLEDMEKYL